MERSLAELFRVSSFPDRFPHYACTAAKSAHSDFSGSRVYASLVVTCHLHFWQNDRGLLRATAVTGGWWNGHGIRFSTQSWLWRRKFFLRSCGDSNSQLFDHDSCTETNKLSPLHYYQYYYYQQLLSCYHHDIGVLFSEFNCYSQISSCLPCLVPTAVLNKFLTLFASMTACSLWQKEACSTMVPEKNTPL